MGVFSKTLEDVTIEGGRSLSTNLDLSPLVFGQPGDRRMQLTVNGRIVGTRPLAVCLVGERGWIAVWHRVVRHSAQFGLVRPSLSDVAVTMSDMATSLHDDLLSMYTTYLDERGYQAAKVAETATKTPDLEVRGHGVVYLNEFKSPNLRLDPAMQMYRFATTNSKLWASIHTALKQFAAHDPSHRLPWVITFASVNFQLCWNSLFEAMQGGSVVDGKVIFNWTRSAEFKRWMRDRYEADLYIWLQVNQRQPYQASFFTNDRSPHRSLVDGFVTNLRAVPLSDVDKNWLLV